MLWASWEGLQQTPGLRALSSRGQLVAQAPGLVLEPIYGQPSSGGMEKHTFRQAYPICPQ